MKIKAIFISLFFVPFLVFAQNGATLPNAGLTPESPFYFLDRLGETLQEFFTFNPEGKARLQITFAAERVAEIKIILETKGIEAKGLEVAQSRLQAHLASAATIVTDQKSKGKDVSALAKELDDELETPKSALADSFKAEKRALETKEGDLKAQLKAANRAGNTAKAETIAQELGQVKAQLELLELKEEDIDDELEAEEEKIEEEIEAQLKAEKAVREAEEEKQELIDEAAAEGVELPANALAEFDSLLTQAKSALATGNFVEAKNLAKQAEKSLDQTEKVIEELENKQEKEEEAEEAISEAEERKQEVEERSEETGKKEAGNTRKETQQKEQGSQELEGIWTIEAEGSKGYYEFKEGRMCSESFDSNGLPHPCSSYQSFTVKGDTLIIGPNTLKWVINQDKLELFIPVTGQRLTLSKFAKPIVKPSIPKDYSITLTPDQLKLQGVWKDLATGNYISFKFYRFTWQGPAGSGEYCMEVIISSSNPTCNGYTEFTMSGNPFTIAKLEATVTLKDGELEITSEVKGGEKSTYAKTTLPPPPFRGVVEE